MDLVLLLIGIGLVLMSSIKIPGSWKSFLLIVAGIFIILKSLYII
ncbi:MAG: hypothetical protein PHX25_03340 [Candidatus Pacebacteria bacterium]|nr:hypothetical protein [Candidatus Paceibacterota bacterium]